MICPRCGAALVVVGRKAYPKSEPPLQPKDDSPEAVRRSLRQHIAVARLSDHPGLPEILDDLEKVLRMLDSETGQSKP